MTHLPVIQCQCRDIGNMENQGSMMTINKHNNCSKDIKHQQDTRKYRLCITFENMIDDLKKKLAETEIIKKTQTETS